MSASAPLLVCYDGSRGAAEAIAFAARLQPGARALVVTAWKPIVEELLAGPGEAPPIADPVEANERQRRAAAETGRDGVRRATAAGLDAEPVVVMAEDALWEAIEEVAIQRDVLLIVCATSRSGLKSALPGNLAGVLGQRSSRPVLVVPSARATAERRRAFEKEHRRRSTFASASRR
jgi:nucleotide-binding universal stress UspA family protein